MLRRTQYVCMRYTSDAAGYELIYGMCAWM